ncbi:MAG: AsnC family transcriptional regulator, partial [Patescibacteria group bacterium]
MGIANFVKYNPVQRFINEVGKEVKRYFGREKGCIIYLLPDGIFYAQALYRWLKSNNKITLTTMDDDGVGLEEEKVRGRKVLIVDNDIVSGKGYKRATEAIRLRKERLEIKDVKFAVFTDRVGLADFSVGGYSAFAPWDSRDLDALDLKIIRILSEDGRKSFVEIAKKTGLSSVAIKNRVERLTSQNLLKVKGLLN